MCVYLHINTHTNAKHKKVHMASIHIDTLNQQLMILASRRFLCVQKLRPGSRPRDVLLLFPKNEIDVDPRIRHVIRECAGMWWERGHCPGFGDQVNLLATCESRPNTS